MWEFYFLCYNTIWNVKNVTYLQLYHRKQSPISISQFNNAITYKEKCGFHVPQTDNIYYILATSYSFPSFLFIIAFFLSYLLKAYTKNTYIFELFQKKLSTAEGYRLFYPFRVKKIIYNISSHLTEMNRSKSEFRGKFSILVSGFCVTPISAYFTIKL